MNLLITGGTGSLGTALCKYLMYDGRYDRVVVYSRGWQRQNELCVLLGNHPKFRYFIGDILSPERLRLAMRGIDRVINTAALKDAIVCEYNVWEGIETNLVGANNVFRAALDSGVDRVLQISSDKSVAPVLAYGAAKHAAEHLAVGYNSYAGGKGTKFSVARYANVVGSNGSVIPLFQRQKGGGRLTLTHPKMSRFWINLDTAVSFILACLDNMQGGEVFIPPMKQARVVDIAHAVAPEAELEIIGMRAGEKIHEVLVAPEEIERTRNLGWAYRVEPAYRFWSQEPYIPTGSPVKIDDYANFMSASAASLTREELACMVQFA